MIEYTVRPGDGLSSICTRFNRSKRVVLNLNATLRTDPDRIRVGDLIVFPDVGEKAPKTKRPASAREPVRDDNQPMGDLIVPRGQLTFDAEGSDTPGPYFSRILHVPPGASGVTLGRGYDMKQRTKTQIRAELTSVGISESVVDVLCGATELTARDARRFIAQVDAGVNGPFLRSTLGGNVSLFPLADVICIYAEDKYTTVVHKNGSLVIDQSLLELENEHADILVRIHRGTLVARKRIRGLDKTSDGSHFLQLEGSEDRPLVSRRNLPAVRKLIRKLT